MHDTRFILFYDEFSQQPAGLFSSLPGLHPAGNLARLTDSLQDENSLVILQAGGKLRQEAIRLLLKANTSFALHGLEPADLLDGARLQTAARKKRIQVCWLGSLRFHQAAARLKELLSGGCLGEIQEYQCHESLNSPWEPYQIHDLLNWLLPDIKHNIIRQPEIETACFTLQVNAARGSAGIRMQKNQMDCLLLKQPRTPEKQIFCPAQAADAELGLLLLLCRMKRPWKMLAKPWECKL